jgi:hypothetical protein
LANAHGLLTDAAGQDAALEDIVRGQLASFAGTISIEGPTVMLKPSAIVGLESSPIIDFQPEGLVYETMTELATIQPSSRP